LWKAQPHALIRQDVDRAIDRVLVVIAQPFVPVTKFVRSNDADHLVNIT